MKPAPAQVASFELLLRGLFQGFGGGDNDGTFGAAVDDIGAGRVGHEGGEIADLAVTIETNVAADASDAEQAKGNRVLREGFDGLYIGTGNDDFANAFMNDYLLVIHRYATRHERRHECEKHNDDAQYNQKVGLVR